MRGIIFLLAIMLCKSLIAGEVDHTVKAMFDRNDVKYTIDSDNDFQVPFRDGNTVVVNSNLSTYRDLTVREIWVVLGEVGEKGSSLMYNMLTENHKRKIGSYSMVVQQGKIYGIYTVRLAAKASWNELWSAILFCSDINLPDGD